MNAEKGILLWLPPHVYFMKALWKIGQRIWCNDWLHCSRSQSVPYVVDVVSLFLSFCLWSHNICIIDILLIVFRYIAIDTILYSYALPIDHSSTSFPSLCLSCNLSQAKGHNRKLIQILMIMRDK